MKRITISFLLVFGSMLSGQDIGMWNSGSFGGPVSYGFPSGDDLYFSQGTKLHKGIEGSENIEIVSTSSLRDAAIQIKINGDNLYAIYGPSSEYKNEITSTTLSNLGSSSSSQFSGIDNGINKFDEIDGFGLLAHNKDGILNDKLVGHDLLGNTNDSFEYVRDFKDFTINGYYAYLITDDGTTDNIIEVVDFTAKSSAQKVGSITVKHAQSVYYSGGYLYVACENGEGLKIIDVSTPTSPILTGEYDANSFTQVIIDGTTAYLRKNKELTIVNIADPANPTYVNVKTLDNITASVEFTDVKNSKIYYLDNGVFGIIDAGTLTISQKYISALTSDWVASDNTTLVVYDKASYYFHSLENTYNPKAYAVLTAEVEPVDFVINGTDFYVTTNNQLYIHDAENLSVPSTEFAYFGEYSALKVANDFAVVGEYKYEGSTKFYYFEIIDLTDKSNPTQLHLAEYPTVGTITSIEISVDNNTLYLASELDGKIWLAIFDITNKSAPTRVYADKLETITSNTIDGKNTKLGIYGTELFVVTNYLTINSYYAAKVFAYSVEESANPRLISGLQITESEYNNVVFLEEMLFVTIPNDQAIRMYSLEGDSTFRKEWTQIETLDLGDEPANMAAFVNKAVPASSIKGDSITDEIYRTGTLYKSKKEKGTEIIYVKVKPKAGKKKLTTSVLPTEAGSGGCSVSPSSGEYEINKVVSVTANVGTGWVFDKWTGNLTGSASPANVTMTTDKNVIGNFKPTLTLGFTSIDAQNIDVPKSDEKVYIGTTKLTAGGVDWFLMTLNYTALKGFKSEYAKVYLDINGKEIEGFFNEVNGLVTGIDFNINETIIKGTTLSAMLYYKFTFPLNLMELLAPLDEVKKLGISISMVQVECEPKNNISGVKIPANFNSNFQTIGWIWNTSLTPHEPFVTLQDANDDPRTLDGHNIEVWEGFYDEYSIREISKSLKITGIGERENIIVAGIASTLIKISADDVEIKNLALSNRQKPTESIPVMIIEMAEEKSNIKITSNRFFVGQSDITAIKSIRNFFTITDNLFELIEKTTLISAFYPELGKNIFSGNKDESKLGTVTIGYSNEGASVRIENNVFSHLLLQDASNVVVSNNKFQMMELAKGGNIIVSENEILDGDFGILINDSEINEISNNTITGIKGNAIEIKGESSTSNKIMKNIISQCDGRGIEIFSAPNSYIYQNEITKAEGKDLSGEILISSVKIGTKTEIIENSFSNLRLENSNGVELFGKNVLSKIDIKNGGKNIIYDNQFKDLDSYGVSIEDSHENEIYDCTISGAKDYGVVIRGHLSLSNWITSNTISLCKTGISLHDASKTSVIGNKIYSNSRYGIFYTGHSNYKSWLNVNSIYDNRIGGVSISGDNCTVSNNKIYYNKIGIELIKSDNTEISSDNRIFENTESGIIIHSGTNTKIASNYINNNKTGIELLGADCAISGNEIVHNCVGIDSKDNPDEKGSSKLVLKGNRIAYNWCLFTGIHIEGGEAELKGNEISGNNGAGIALYNDAIAEISGNNIYDNPDLAVLNENLNSNLNVDNNYWGSTTAPDDGSFSGSINYTNWLDIPISLIISKISDTLKTASGLTDSINISFQNFVFPSDQILVTVTDEQGWLTNSGTTQVDLTDSTIALLSVKFNVPSDAGSSFNNKVFISAVSLTNPEMTSVDSFYILNYTPELASITVSPDSIALALGDSLQFSAFATDQYEKEFSGTANYNWSVSEGTIDSIGYFRADSTSQVVTITVTETNSNITASANINVQPHINISEVITIYPDSVVVPINGTVQFYAEGKDANGFNVEFNKYWISSGGPIDSTGFYTAGDIAGEYHVIVQDQYSGAEATAKVIIGTPTSVESVRTIPKEYSLNQNYPNPFNPSTTISYALPYDSKVKVEIFNMLGQRVDIIANGVESSGVHSTLWDATHLASGIYIIRINATSISSNSNFTKSIKMILMK